MKAKKKDIFTIEEIIKNDLFDFAESSGFKIDTFNEFSTVLQSLIAYGISNKLYYNNQIEIPKKLARLYGKETPIVHANNIVKWLSKDNAEGKVFKYCLSHNWGGWLLYKPEKDELLNQLCEYYLPSTNKSMSVVTTRSAIMKKANSSSIKRLLYLSKVANIDVTETAIKKKISTGFTNTSTPGMITKKDTKKAVTDLINIFKHKKNWKLYNGYAGTGKTYNAVHSVKKTDNILCMSLAWTIPLNLKQRLIANGIPSKNITCKPYAAMHKIDFSKYDTIIIDEISQCGIIEYKKFYNMFRAAPNANYIFMGDVHQIKSFLSGGSLLNTLLEEFKGDSRVNILTQIKRTTNKALSNAVINFANNGTLNKIFNCPEKYKLSDYDVIITGANVNVARLNNEYVKEKFKTASQIETNINSMNYDCQSYDIDTNRMLVDAMKKGYTINVLGKAGKSTSGIKIETNEKWKAKYIRSKNVIALTSEIDPAKKIQLPIKSFINAQFFVPGYAINVNKAQGLEWEKVLVKINMDKSKGTLDRNLYEDRESMYVALSRGQNTTHLDCNGEIKNVCTPYQRANNYKEVK